MGLTKTDMFSDEQNELATMAKTIGHPARIAILQFLAGQESCVCGSIVKEIGLAQATVSQHLKALKSAGLIQGNIDGVSTRYCIDMKQIMKVNNQLGGLLTGCCSNLSCR